MSAKERVAPLSIGERLRWLREAKGVSQSELGRLTGLTGQGISNYENGYREPRIGNLEAMMAALDLPMATLFDYPLWEQVAEQQRQEAEARERATELIGSRLLPFPARAVRGEVRSPNAVTKRSFKVKKQDDDGESGSSPVSSGTGPFAPSQSIIATNKKGLGALSRVDGRDFVNVDELPTAA